MKILKLHFKNLNSLVGEWEIDFTAPEYTAQGIFAIIGPTGAGKSTILDAICLALYGRTPRLERINTNQNEIMSRQYGECFANLEFQTASGRYRAKWSQTRAHKKADGNLQTAQHTIEDCLNNKIIEDKLSKTLQVVIEVTGMDFEHFTRAMLLAQGGFAKFLQSSADERSPILEKITGTEIYTQISKLVHERKTSEEHNLNTLNAQLSGINLLNTNELAELQAELARLGNQIAILTTNKTTIEQQQIWLTNLQKLHDELTIIQVAQQQLHFRQTQFVPDELRLKAAKLVEEINSDIYIQLQELRKQLKDVKLSLCSHQEQLPQLQELVITQQNEANLAKNELVAYKVTHTHNLKILQQVRLLDADITAKKAELAKVTTKINAINNQLDTLRITHQDLTQQQSTIEHRQHQINNYLAKYPNDAKLVTTYSGICAELDNLLALEHTLKNNHSEQINHANHQAKLTTLITEQEAQQTTYYLEYSQLNDKISQIEGTIQLFTKGKSIATLKDEVLQLNGQANDYRELLKLVQEQAGITVKLQQINTDLTTEQNSITNLEPKLDRDNQILEVTNQLLDNLLVQQLLQSKISSLTAERTNLQPSQPCPLCGSLEHPYATDGVVVNNELAKQISDAKNKISQLQITLAEYTKQIATNYANIAKLSEQQTDLITSQEQVHYSINNLANNYRLTITNINEAFIRGQLDLVTEQLTNLTQQITQLQDYEMELANAKTKLQQVEKALHIIKLEVTRLAEQQLASEQRLIELMQVIRQINEEYAKLASEIGTKLVDYQIPAITSATIPAIKDNLAKRRDAWLNNEQQANMIKEDLQRLAYQLEQNSNSQQALQVQMGEQQSEVTILQQGVKQLTTHRTMLFADKNADTAEAQWNDQLQALDEKTQAINDTLNQLMQQEKTLLALINQDQAQVELLCAKQLQLEEQFITRLNLVNIANEAEFITKRLSREEIVKLQQTADSLKQQAIELTNRYKHTSEILSLEQAKQLTVKTSQELQAEIIYLKANYEEYNQRIGAIREQLNANQQARQEQQDTIAKRDKQLQITERYRRLHVLIGSSDGKKFRNFAQGLTFELVVKHANQQLRQISDRYLLIRDNNAPLELNVLDNYQGGEIRTTKNLSGGESFVISLALALGLSKLSSHKVQVDSLFLDEGFGTLDEDSLQTALDALDSLQRDGKLIGVISHVGALKDRISLQIQVEPLSGGVSRISGTGCRKN